MKNLQEGKHVTTPIELKKKKMKSITLKTNITLHLPLNKPSWLYVGQIVVSHS